MTFGRRVKEIDLGKDTCTPMFIAALFTIARTWKQPKCPSADEWIRKLWYIYAMEYYVAIKIILSLCTPVVITALFTVARTQKQPRCPSADEWIRKLCTYTQWNITQLLKRTQSSQF